MRINDRRMDRCFIPRRTSQRVFTRYETHTARWTASGLMPLALLITPVIRCFVLHQLHTCSYLLNALQNVCYLRGKRHVLTFFFIFLEITLTFSKLFLFKSLLRSFEQL